MAEVIQAGGLKSYVYPFLHTTFRYKGIHNSEFLYSAFKSAVIRNLNYLEFCCKIHFY